MALTMRAVQVHDYGAADVLRVTNVPIPRPGAGCARIRVEAIGVNFVDVYYRTGAYPSGLPLIPGMEAVGVVEALGPATPDNSPAHVSTGTRVAYVMQLGAYAEHVVVPWDRLVPVPDELASRQAAAVSLQGMTAHFLSEASFGLSAGDTALIHAAAGGLGQVLTQLLVRRGVRVIGVVSTTAKVERAKQAGADAVVVNEQADLLDEVRRLTGGAGAAAVYDSVGKDTWRASLACVRPRGHLVLCGQSSGPVPPLDPQLLRAAGSVWLSRPSLTHFVADPANCAGGQQKSTRG